jgi:3-hydroxyisobutyrate dehydrogenase
MAKHKIAVLGLGIMGGGMARRLLSSGFPVYAYNRTRDRAALLEKAGAIITESPREAASRAEIVISMVADDQASRNVWLGEAGALAGAAKGSLLIESSTVSVAWVRELGATAAERRFDFVDAPVTGTKPHAQSGELFYMVGGSESAFARAREVLSVLGREVLHMGPTGSGALIKLINNFVCGVQAASFAEALALVGASGIDREKCVAVLSNSALASPLIKRMVTSMAANDYTPNFPLKLMTKDIGYAMNEASREGVSLETAGPALKMFQHATQQGLGDSDFSAIVKSVAKNSRN